MEITQEQIQGQAGLVPVTIFKLVGELDASSFKQVIASAQSAYHAGARNLLLDLGEMSFMSSSGLVALHSIALLMRGERTPDLEDGWDALHAIADYVDGAGDYEKHFKLLNPQPRVVKTLQKAGFDRTFEVFSEREAAIAAFN